MKYILTLLLLLATTSISYAGQRIEDGTLLYVYNGNQIVQGYTDSKVTHVGIIVNINGEPYLYEADVPEVRRLKFIDYLMKIAVENKNEDPSDWVRIHLIQPSVPFTGAQVERMKIYLDSKLKMRYSIRSYLHKKPVDSGVHCAELATTALNSTGRYRFTNPSAVSPKSLVYYMSRTYGESQKVAILVPVKDSSWCNNQQHWWEKTCTWCGWSCVESGKETLHWAVPSVDGTGR